MGEVLTNGVYLPDRGERNAYDGLKGNWNTLDSIAGKVPGYDAHISDTDIHVTAADKQTWNGKADASHVHNANDVTTGVFDAARIPNLDASKITTGTIDIDRLPQGALERLVKVADQTARYALTASDVQLGDTVQQLDTGVMYVVTDVTKLDSADGYTEYTAGSATSVPWSGVTGKPADYTPASHSHGNITNDGKVGTTANLPLITGTDGVIQAGSFGNSANTFCEGNDSRLSDARTPVAHTHGKADITDLFNSANTWTGDNTFNGSNSFNSGLTINNAALLNAVLQNAVKGNVSTTGDFAIFIKDKVNGNAATSLLTVYRGGQDSNGSYAQIDIDTKGNDNNRYNNSILFRINPADNSNDAVLIPRRNSTTDLGTSTNKWKTLNGINPGALSLPVTALDNTYDISGDITDLTGGNNSITAARTGWIFVKSDNATEISIENTTTGMGASDHSASATTLMVSIPVTSGETLNIIANCISIDKAYLLPCQGNV